MATQSKAANASSERLREYGREVRRESDALAESVRGAVGEMQKLAVENVEGRPYLALGAAFGFGLVLGGGVPIGAMRFAARTAASMAVSALVETMMPARGRRAGGRRRRRARDARPCAQPTALADRHANCIHRGRRTNDVRDPSVPRRNAAMVIGNVKEATAEATDAAREMAAELSEELPAMVRSADSWLRDAAAKQPLLALGAAVAAGYALGRLMAKR